MYILKTNISLKNITFKYCLEYKINRSSLKVPYLVNRHTMNKVDFYTCWDDINPIQKALDINSNDIVLTITSGGCNVFNFLFYDPKKIISVDYNPYQKYLMELKIESIRNLDYTDFLEMIGVRSSNKREKHYEHIREHLGNEAREYWDSNQYALEKGILYVGEQNVKVLGKILRFFKGREVLESFFKCKTIDEQADYFYKKIYCFPWKLFLDFTYNNYITKITLCLRMLRDYPVKKKRPPEYFKYIQKVSYYGKQRKKIEEVLTKIPIQDNYFASLMLLGCYINENCFPPYLKRESFNIIKKRIDRIQLKTAFFQEDIKEYPDNYITKFNLSNIFDWCDDHHFKRQLKEIVRVGKNKSRIFYSVTREDRAIPDNIEGLHSEKHLSIQLLEKDRTILYSNFEIGEIRK